MIYQLNKEYAIATTKVHNAGFLLVHFISHPVYYSIHHPLAKPDLPDVSMVVEILKLCFILLIPTSSKYGYNNTYIVKCCKLIYKRISYKFLVPRIDGSSCSS